jgi:hypothetical protein
MFLYMGRWPYGPFTWYGSSMLGTSTERRAVPHNLVAAVPVVVMPLLARLVMVRIIARKGIDGLRDKAYCPTCECP